MEDMSLVSPDGSLRFLVRSPDGDITMGFEGYPWHTHGDLLLDLSQRDPEAAAAQFVADLVAGRLLIAVASVSGDIRDIWITADPLADLRYCPTEELIEFRLWDGTPISPDPARERQHP